jgi:hypothetical protein
MASACSYFCVQRGVNRREGRMAGSVDATNPLKGGLSRATLSQLVDRRCDAAPASAFDLGNLAQLVVVKDDNLIAFDEPDDVAVL